MVWKWTAALSASIMLLRVRTTVEAADVEAAADVVADVAASVDEVAAVEAAAVVVEAAVEALLQPTEVASVTSKEAKSRFKVRT